MSLVPIDSQSSIISNRWIDCRLTDTCISMDYGLTASATDDSSGVKFLRITDIVSGHVNWDTVPYVTVSEEVYRKYQLRDGDIVIARTGASTGASAFIQSPPKAVFASYLVRLNIKPEFDPRFLAYCLKSEDFWAFMRGVLGDKSAQPNASASTMGKAPLNIPEIKTDQRRISHILGTLDDKIQLNRRMNATLEGMARALFKSWFVDFEPVRAKMEGRWRRGESLPGMSADMYDLFPERLVPSELGDVPEGWKVGTIDDIARSPRRNVSPSDVEEGTPYIGLQHMPRRSIALTEWSTSEDVTSTKATFKKGEFLFGKLRPYFHKVGVAAVNGVCSTDIVVLTPTTDNWSAFLLCCVSTDEFVGYTDQTSTGTRMPRTSWKAMKQFETCLPPNALASAFQRITEPMLKRIVMNCHESQSLAKMRDALLPGLVSENVTII